MKGRGRAARTTLEKLDIIEHDDKSSLSMVLSGRVIDLAEVRKVLAKQFPDSFIEKDKNTLRCVVPLKHEDDAPTASDIVEKVIDSTYCKLGYHFSWVAKPHGSKVVPELIMELDKPHDHGSFYGRTIMDIMSRRLDPEKTTYPLKNYTYERSPNGSAIIIRPRDEVCDTAEEAERFCMMMISHFRHRFEEAPHHLRISGFTLMPNEIQSDEKGADGDIPVARKACLTLKGELNELRMARIKLVQEEGITTAMVPSDDEPGKKDLHVYAEISDHFDASHVVGTVHMATGCKLPVELIPGVFPERAPSPVTGYPEVSFNPAVAMLFNTPDTHYDELLVHALGIYTASFTKDKTSLRIPLIVNPFSGKQFINLSAPTSVVLPEPYSDLEEAKIRARKVVSRLNQLLSHDGPDESIGRDGRTP